MKVEQGKGVEFGVELCCLPGCAAECVFTMMAERYSMVTLGGVVAWGSMSVSVVLRLLVYFPDPRWCCGCLLVCACVPIPDGVIWRENRSSWEGFSCLCMWLSCVAGQEHTDRQGRFLFLCLWTHTWRQSVQTSRAGPFHHSKALALMHHLCYRSLSHD